MVIFRTKNGNTQILAFLLNVKSSSAKIRVPDPLLVKPSLLTTIFGGQGVQNGFEALCYRQKKNLSDRNYNSGDLF